MHFSIFQFLNYKGYCTKPELPYIETSPRYLLQFLSLTWGPLWQLFEAFMPSYRCPKGERFKNCKRYLGLVFAITLSYSLYFQKRKIVFLFIFVYFLYFSIFKIIIHFYFMKYDIYAPKYLFNNPSNPLPCLASSLHISCTVSWIAS